MPILVSFAKHSFSVADVPCALAAVGRVSVVPWHAVLALLPGGEVPALLTHVAADARAVSVTLASWTLDKGPLIVLFFGAKTGVESHVAAVSSTKLHRPP